jgi:hypothetical protein
VLAPVHDADDDGACGGCDLDEVESRFFGGPAGLLERDDADLLPAGADEPDGAEVDLVVDTDFIVDTRLPPCCVAGERKPWKSAGI